MKKAFLIVLLIIFSNLLLLSQDSLAINNEPIVEHQQNKESLSQRAFINLGVWDKISTNGKATKNYTNNVSLNLVFGQSENVYGLAFSGLCNSIVDEARGVVISPFNITRTTKGVQIGGVQAADDVNGLQIGVVNVAEELSGVQFGGFINASKITTKGAQVGGFNQAYGSMSGVQLGFMNGAVKSKGLQIGAGNLADTVTGVQIGAINCNAEISGLQIGVVNISNNNKYPIGLINIIKDGELNLALTFDDMQNMVASFRSGGRYLYGIVGFGYNLYSPQAHFVFEGGLGAHILFSDRFRIDTEIIASTLTKIRTSIKFGEQSEEEKEREEEIYRNYDFKTIYRFAYRILPSYKINDRFNIFAGPTLNYLQTSKMDNRKIFPSHSLWKDYNDKTLKQLHIGWMMGVGYTF